MMNTKHKFIRMKRKTFSKIEIVIIIASAFLSLYFFSHWDAIEKFIGKLF